MKRLPILCTHEYCTACEACRQTCPRNAIRMIQDEKGFLYPEINENKCVGCLLCENICPQLASTRNVNPAPSVYACWHLDDRIRKISSSGGAFSAIAEYILDLKGYVWGAVFSDGLKLTYQCINDISDLDKLRRSKYVQAEIGDAYIQIAEQLKTGNWVLYTGTSCHVRGLYAYLPETLHSRLVTVDFVCHGVPSPKVFSRYISWIEKRYGDRLSDFNFRDKSYGWDNGILTVGTFANIGKKKFYGKENSFFYGMLHDIFTRPCCYQCTSNGLQRESDFTIADFWGIGRKEKFEYDRDKHHGISMLALNSGKSYEIFNENLKNRLFYLYRPAEEAFENNWSYIHPVKNNPATQAFWSEFSKGESWNDVLQFLRPTLGEQCRLIVKRFLGPVISNKLRKLLKK